MDMFDEIIENSTRALYVDYVKMCKRMGWEPQPYGSCYEKCNDDLEKGDE